MFKTILAKTSLVWELEFASYARSLIGEESLQSRWSRKAEILRHARVLALATCMGSIMGALAACSVSDDAILTGSSEISAQAQANLPTTMTETDSLESASADAASMGDVEDSAERAEATDDGRTQPAEIADAAGESGSMAAAADHGTDAGQSAPALAVVAEERPGPSPFARLFSRQSDAPAENDRSAAMLPGGDDPAALAEPVVSETADDEVVEGDEIEMVEADDIEAAEDDVAPMTTASINGSGSSPAAPGQRESILLPGVRDGGSLYRLANRSHFDYHSYDNDNGSVQVASAVGMAALAGRRLQVQHAGVNVSCLKPRLVQILRQIESRFGQPVVVTSGYRDRQHNRRVGGARESKHMSCEAADIQVKGVTKWQIAEFVRTLPGRGGVGTYCHTESVHVDIGSKRDWNWRCRRRS